MLPSWELPPGVGGPALGFGMLRLRVCVSRRLGEMDSEARSPLRVVLPAGPPARLTHPFSARWCPGRQCLCEQRLCVSVSRGPGLSCASREGAYLAPVLPVLLALEEASGTSGSQAPGVAAWRPPRSHSLPAARQAWGSATRAPNPPGGQQWVVGCWASGTNL